jgi:hypothetical protein
VIGFIGTSLQLQLIITVHTLNSFLTTSVWRISMKIFSLPPECRTGLYYSSNSRMHCLCHAAGIEVTMSNSSSVLLCCQGNAFVNISCRWNKCLPSRFLPMDVCSGSTIPTFSRHVTVLSTDCYYGGIKIFSFWQNCHWTERCKRLRIIVSLSYDHTPVSRNQDLEVENWYEFSFIVLYTSNYT